MPVSKGESRAAAVAVKTEPGTPVPVAKAASSRPLMTAVAKRAARAAAVVKHEPEAAPVRERTPSPEAESKPASLHMVVEEFGVSERAPPQPALPLVDDTRPAWQSYFGDKVAAEFKRNLDELPGSSRRSTTFLHTLSPAPRRPFSVEEQQAESDD